MNQRTPFTNIDDARKEFETIFKQKSANEWATALTDFEKQKKKYSLVKVHYSNIKHKDYLAPFDYENCVKTSLSSQRVFDLIEEISNLTIFQRAVTQFKID